MPIVLITNDAENLRRALAEGLNAMSSQVLLLLLPLLHLIWASFALPEDCMNDCTTL